MLNLSSLRSRRLKKTTKTRRSACRLQAEQLEDRRLLALVTIDPGAFDASSYNIDGGAAMSGIQTVDLDAGSYSIRLPSVTGNGSFSFDVDAVGNVTQSTGSAVGGANSLTFNNETIHVDPANWERSWRFGSHPSVTGESDIVVVPGINNYSIRFDTFAELRFDVDASGNVSQGILGSIVGGPNSLTFNTTTVHVDPGDFPSGWMSDRELTLDCLAVDVLRLLDTGADFVRQFLARFKAVTERHGFLSGRGDGRRNENRDAQYQFRDGRWHS